MKMILILLTLTLLCSTSSFGVSMKDDLNWAAGAGFGSAGSSFHLGALLHGLVPVGNIDSNQVLVGGETGLLLGFGTVSSFIIPILIESQINFKGNGKVTPFAGLAMGASIANRSAKIKAGGLTVSESYTSTDFAILMKGGVYFGHDSKYFFELPFGTLGSSFSIFPNVGMRF